jgi:hypothetical protein
MFTADKPLQIVAIGLIVVGLVMLARSWLLPWALVRRLPASAYMEHQLDVDDQGIRQTAAHISVQLSWSGFVSASRDRHVWILRHKDEGPPTMIARRHLTDDQESRLTSCSAPVDSLSNRDPHAVASRDPAARVGTHAVTVRPECGS